MAGVLEYLTMEILESAKDAAHEKKKKTIQPVHLQKAIRGDEELGKLMANVQISAGGMEPNISSVLFPGKKGTIALPLESLTQEI